MPTPNSCCNPLKKKNHGSVRTNILLITEKYDSKFDKFVGKYMCVSCKTRMYVASDLVHVEVEKTNDPDEEENDVYSIDEEEDDVSRDSSFPPQHKIERGKIIGIVQEITNASNKRAKLDISDDERRNLIEITEKIQSKLRSEIPGNNDQLLKWVKDLKEAISRQPMRSEKIFLLTTLPVEWSVRKMAKVFGVSRRLATRAKKLRATEGFASRVNPKTGHPLDVSIVEKVKKFYLSDEISRVSPGKKDSKSVVIDGKRQHVTVSFLRSKRVFLYNFLNIVIPLQNHCRNDC